MMRSFLWILSFVLTLASCSGVKNINDPKNSLDRQGKISEDIPDHTKDNNRNSGMEGYIVFSEPYILLIEDPNFNQADIHLSVKELQRNYKEISFLYKISESQKKQLQSGQKVKIDAQMILESYPAKVYVSKIEVIDNQ